jgi:AraC-like DNA-binding protein
VIGARFGFFDLSSLARQFRAQFGHSMSAVRDHFARQQMAAIADEGLSRFRTAFEGLSSPALRTALSGSDQRAAEPIG